MLETVIGLCHLVVKYRDTEVCLVLSDLAEECPEFRNHAREVFSWFLGKLYREEGLIANAWPHRDEPDYDTEVEEFRKQSCANLSNQDLMVQLIDKIDGPERVW